MKLASSRSTVTKYTPLALLAVVFLFLAVLPTWHQGYSITLLTEIMKFVILTVAWVMFSGQTGYISLATAAFYGLGFYLAAVLSGKAPFLLIIAAAGAIGFVTALIVGALALRLRGIYFCILTFGLVLLIDQVIREVEQVLSGTRGRFVDTQPTEIVYLAMFGVCVVTILVAWLLKRSRHGLALMSIGQNEEAAAHSGIDVVRTKVLVFALSAVFMAMAGAVIATRRSYVDPGVAFSLNQTFLPVLMALFGGMQNLAGPVIGAVIFAFLRERLLTSFPEVFMLIFGAILIVAILFLPKGVVQLIQQGWEKIREVKGRGRAPAEGEGIDLQ